MFLDPLCEIVPQPRVLRPQTTTRTDTVKTGFKDLKRKLDADEPGVAPGVVRPSGCRPPTGARPTCN